MLRGKGKGCVVQRKRAPFTVGAYTSESEGGTGRITQNRTAESSSPKTLKSRGGEGVKFGAAHGGSWGETAVRTLRCMHEGWHRGNTTFEALCKLEQSGSSLHHVIDKRWL